ncbi:hypothetical protein AKJ16_DCAP19904 [Drosera capensis]
MSSAHHLRQMDLAERDQGDIVLYAGCGQCCSIDYSFPPQVFNLYMINGVGTAVHHICGFPRDEIRWAMLMFMRSDPGLHSWIDIMDSSFYAECLMRSHFEGTYREGHRGCATSLCELKCCLGFHSCWSSLGECICLSYQASILAIKGTKMPRGEKG